jgi:hypothetical protein
MRLQQRFGAVIAIVCAVALALAMADTARAGQYVMRTCNVPAAERTTVGPWHLNAMTAGTFYVDDCAGGGGFGFNAGTIPWGTPTGMTLETPPAIFIRRIRLWMVVRLRSTGDQLFAVVESGGPSGSAPVGLFGDPGGSTLADPYVSPVLPADTTVYHVLVNCVGGAMVGCTAVDSNVLDIHGIEATLEEGLAPTGSIDGGELLAGGPQAGVRALTYSAKDLQSGVASVSALLGTVVVGAADFTGECAHADFAACPQVRNGVLSVDTRKVADGIYPVTLRVRDAAGNEQTVVSPTAIQVANGAGSAVGQGGTTAGRLIASFTANHRVKLTVGYGRRVRIRGRLLGPSNEPIGGAIVQAGENPASALASPRSGSVTTAPDGSFSYTTGPGTSRTIVLTYGGASIQLRLRVKASATLEVSLRGITVRYGGRVLSRPLPKRGKLVEIEGRAPGAGWKTFAKRRTDRRGRYAGTYRLRIHRPGVRLQFRVRVPAERGYPFVAHAGRALGRIVR